MKILFVANRLGGGGAERVLSLLANQLAKDLNNKVSVLEIHKTDRKYTIDSNIRILELAANGGTVSVIKKLKGTIRQEKPDVIVAFEYHVNMKVILAARGFKDTRVVISERNDPARKGGSFPLKQVRNFLYPKADVLVCQTPDAKAYFPQKVQERAVIIPNPVKADLPEPFCGKRKKTVVNFCRLNPQKNLKLLIDAFEEFHRSHPDYVLEIYGDGELGDELKNYAAEKGLSSCVYINAAVADIHERILDAGMFVSSSDYEGLSNSMLEAMALGIPTICTDCPCGGARMVIEDGVNGLLVPVGDKERMVEAMSKVAEDEGLALNLSTEAVKIRVPLSSEFVVKKWAEVFI